MNTRHRILLGFWGVALGNALLAVGQWLRAGEPFLVASQLLLTVVFVVIAALWWRDDGTFDSPWGGRFERLAGPVFLALAAITVLLGSLSVALALE